MKKLLFIICCFIFIHYNAAAQYGVDVETATINKVVVILPTFNNLLKLLHKENMHFNEIMQYYHYTQSKPNEPNTFQANSPDHVYKVQRTMSVNGDPRSVQIFFSDRSSSSPSDTKVEFLQSYPYATHKIVDGRDAYYFDFGARRDHYCILFDLPEGGGGTVALIIID
jgi:hypothetical protein